MTTAAMPTKYIFVTGGVVSSLGKGLAAASIGCLLETRGRSQRLSRPRLYHDERRRAVPAPARLVLGLAHVSDFLELTRDDGAAEQMPLRRLE